MRECGMSRPASPALRTLTPPTLLGAEEDSSPFLPMPSDKDNASETILCRHSRSLSLIILVTIFISNQACRALLFYLVNFSDTANAENAMNVALDFGPGKYGFLATLGFTIPFTAGSLLAGVLADKADRTQMSAVAGVLWSVCTLLMAFASSFWEQLVLRMLLGLAQSATNPAALSLLGELFPEARATVSSVFGLGIYIGGGMASLGAAIDDRFGWRDTCLVFGVGSILVSLTGLLPRDPRGGHQARLMETTLPETSESEPSLLPRVLSSVSSISRSMPVEGVLHRTLEATASKAARWMLLASTLRFCAGFGIMVWLPSAMHAHFPDRFAEFSVCNSMIKALAGGASSLAGGMASDMLRNRGFGDSGGALFCAVSSVVSAPLWYLVLHVGFSFELCMGFLVAEYLTAESWLGPAVATLQSAVPPDRRGAAQGVFSSLTALGNAFPACLGYLPAEQLASGLQVSVTVCYLASAACFAVAAYHLHREPLETSTSQMELT